jgi:hypothetical protein
MRLKLPELPFGFQLLFPAAYPALSPKFGGSDDLHASLELKNRQGTTYSAACLRSVFEPDYLAVGRAVEEFRATKAKLQVLAEQCRQDKSNFTYKRAHVLRS